MNRRAFVAGTLALVLLAAPLAAEAQPAGKVYRIGYLGIYLRGLETDPQLCPVKGNSVWRAWVEGLREHGYIPGRNLVIECRWTEGREDRAPTLAVELVNLKVDLLVALGTNQVRAAKQATTGIPILMAGVIEPVGRGLVASLAHPGGNVTGLTDSVGIEIIAKHFQLLKEIVPTASQVAYLEYSGGGFTPQDRFGFGGVEDRAARALGLTLHGYAVQTLTELRGAFAAMTTARVQGLVVGEAFWGDYVQPIVELAAKSRLPAVYPGRVFVEAGGLLSYDANDEATRRRLGDYVDKIFHGAKPGDLPVEQPTKFDLLVNLKTAKTLGLTIPPAVLARADEVIQ